MLPYKLYCRPSHSSGEVRTKAEGARVGMRRRTIEAPMDLWSQLKNLDQEPLGERQAMREKFLESFRCMITNCARRNTTTPRS